MVNPMASKLESTVKIIRDEDIPLPPWRARPGWSGVQRVKPLIGSQTPTERFQLAHAYFEPNTHEPLHWHLTEVAYYVLSGVAYPYDVNGKVYELKQGAILYAGPGIAGAHAWQSRDQPFELLAIRASADPATTYPQFNIIDEQTKQSTVEFDSLVSAGKKRSLW